MKKVIFMALATVFMLSSGFESSNIIVKGKLTDATPELEIVYDCNYAIVRTAYNGFGRPYAETKHYSVNTIGPEDCEGHKSFHLAGLSAGVSRW
jgi:hypothetical protein